VSADQSPAAARVVLGVRGLDTEPAERKVVAAIAAVAGVRKVEVVAPQQLLVSYDASEATVMDMIRAARRLGFLAGME